MFIVFLLAFLALLLSRKPSNNRNWAEDFAILPTIEQNPIEKNIYKVFNIRNWTFNANGPTQKNYIDREVDINKINNVWFMLQPFGAYDLVAHAFVIFDFEDSCPIAISVEARKEDGEKYSVFKGLVKEFEISYLWLTEQDVYTNRVIFNDDALYMYPLKIDKASAQKLFVSYVNVTNDLQNNPKFYNTFTDNCTNAIASVANNASLETKISKFAIGNYITGLSLP